MAGMRDFSRLVFQKVQLVAAFLAPYAAMAEPLHSAESRLSLPDAAIAFELAAAEQGFQVSLPRDLSGELLKQGFEISPTLTLELNHPGLAAALLRNEPQAAILMPLKASLHSKGDMTHLMLPSPIVLLAGCGLRGSPTGEAEALDKMIAAVSRAFESKGALTEDDLWRATMRSYRQALVGTGTGETELALKASPLAAARWKQFLALTKAPSGDADWMQDAASVQRLLEEASTLVQSGRSPEAHEVLEGVRAAWLKMRSRNGRNPLEDKITLYHNQMEAFLGSLSAMGKPEDRSRAQENLALLKDCLNQVLAHKSDKRAPLLQTTFESLSSGLVNSLKAAEAAMKEGNPAVLKALGKTMKPPFIKFYLSFG